MVAGRKYCHFLSNDVAKGRKMEKSDEKYRKMSDERGIFLQKIITNGIFPTKTMSLTGFLICATIITSLIIYGGLK